MTERKGDYILEALGQIEDKYIEEAVTYKKPKISFLYRKELGVLAACFAVVLLATFAYQYMPIRSVEEMDNVQATESIDITEGTEVYEAAKETYSYGISYEMVVAEYAEVTDAAQGKNGEQKEMNGEQTSQGSNVTDKVATQEICAYPEAQVENLSYSLAWVPAEEILAQDVAVFMGTVTRKEVYHVTSGIETVFTVLTVQVEDSIKGNAEVEKSYKIYIPVGEADGIVTDNSISGDLLKLDVGSRAIFMPRETSAEVGRGASGTAEAWLSYADFAEYYISEGIRYLILETNGRLSFEQNVYKIEGGSAATLEEAADYLRELLKEDAEVTAQ